MIGNLQFMACCKKQKIINHKFFVIKQNYQSQGTE